MKSQRPQQISGNLQCEPHQARVAVVIMCLSGDMEGKWKAALFLGPDNLA